MALLAKANRIECASIMAESSIITINDDFKLLGNITFNSTPSNNDVLMFTEGKWQASPAPVGDPSFSGNVDIDGTLNVGTIYGPLIPESTVWTQLGQDINEEAYRDQSGISIAMSSNGDTVAIGAYLNDGNGGSAGHVRVYGLSGSVWVQRGNDIDGEAAGDWSGISLAMSSDGNTVAIGALNNDGNGVSSGHVRVYDWSGTVWVQRGLDIDGEAAGDDSSGSSLDMSSDGNTVAIGAPNNDGNGINSGHVRVYDWSGSAWVKRGADIDGEAAGDGSVFNVEYVALSSDGNTVAIGAPNNDGNGSNSGHVRVYDWSGTVWGQRGQDIDGEAADDRSGSYVAMSSDGNTVAIGTRYNDGNGSYSGHVRVYDWSGSTWVQRGGDIDGEAAGNRSGVVAISSNGNTLAIGAFFNNGNGMYSGHTRIYDWSGSSWMQRGNDIDGRQVGAENGRSVALSSDGNIVAIGASATPMIPTALSHAQVYKWTRESRPIDMCETDLININTIRFESGIIIGNVNTSATTSTISIGKDADSFANNSIAIGTCAVVLLDNSISLGYNIVAGQEGGFFVRHRGPGVYTNNPAGFISGTNELVEVTSSRRFKENIRDLEEVTDVFDSFRPVRYVAKPGHGDDREHIGLIAEEVEEIFPEFITYDQEGQVTGILFDRIVAVTIQRMKEMRRDESEQNDLIAKLEETILLLEKQYQ